MVDSYRTATILDTVGVASQQRRATAIMNAVYGVAWFLDSVLMGALYDASILVVVLASALLQAAALPVFLRLAERES
jgi:predicted MFS family arabinose efflux permease